MWRNTPFKICIVLSACTHIAIIYPWPFLQSMSRPEISFQRIELTYFEEGAIQDVLIKDLKPITSVKQASRKKNIEMVKLEKVKIDLKKSSESKFEQKPIVAKNTISGISKDSRQKNSDTTESASKDEIIRENYCLKVREKIKSILEKKSKRFTGEGEIYARFIINRNGILKNLTMHKGSGKGTHLFGIIAIESIKEASPFPSFGDEIKENELLFKLPIRFTYHP